MKLGSRLLLGVLVILAIVVATVLVLQTRGTSQPIQFNHRKHKDQGVTCDVCHKYYNRQAASGIPTVRDCLLCHEEPLTKSPEEEKIRKFARENQEIPWNRLYRQPTHVYFSHRRHVALSGLPCERCHGSIGVSTRPPRHRAVNQNMDFCMNCHKKMKASNDCLVCHK